MSQENETLSREEIQRRKQELTDFYTESIQHLKVQLEYEQLLRDIAKARAEKLQADAFVAQVMSNIEEDDEEETEAPQGRTLRRSN
jgi:hypothetical protein